MVCIVLNTCLMIQIRRRDSVRTRDSKARVVVMSSVASTSLPSYVMGKTLNSRYLSSYGAFTDQRHHFKRCGYHAVQKSVSYLFVSLLAGVIKLLNRAACAVFSWNKVNESHLLRDIKYTVKKPMKYTCTIMSISSVSFITRAVVSSIDVVADGVHVAFVRTSYAFINI